ncbi:hypothetical protein AB0K62_05130 [Streptomyces halstedii]|uniref:hypothetical protein n=1 Tax=Streptomyces halstedii TaxID=1944 RepID=UPI00346113A5
MPNDIAPREHGTGLSETSLSETTPYETTPYEMSLSELRGDCARMAPRWAAAGRSAAGPVDVPRIHGVTVPPGSARLIDAMADYGD